MSEVNHGEVIATQLKEWNIDHCQTQDLTHVLSETSRIQDPVLSEVIDEEPLIFENEVKVVKRKRAEGNLALAIAKRMPGSIRTKVQSMINYYEDHISDHIFMIHKLTEENKRMKHRLQLNCDYEDKQNSMPTKNNISNQPQLKPVISERQKQKQDRIHQLQQIVLGKNTEIVNLNQQITDLYGKVKKYKKRVYELQSRSKSPCK